MFELFICFAFKWIDFVKVACYLIRLLSKDFTPAPMIRQAHQFVPLWK